MRIPKHIAIIPDGNRRWASKNGLEKQEGYEHGLVPGLSLLKCAIECGVEEITYYGFTVDNCKRPLKQQEAFRKACVDAVEIIKKEGDVSLLVIGDNTSECFPKELGKYTKRVDIGNPKLKVNFLVNYGWNWDISGVYKDEKTGDILKDIHSSDISRIDLVIRWGNMRRLSGLLPIQSVYADFYIVENLWPDFKEEDFYKAIEWYQMQDVTLGG